MVPDSIADPSTECPVIASAVSVPTSLAASAEPNHAAIGLYRSLSVKEVGRRNDRFRIAEISVNDITMTLGVKGEVMDGLKP